MENGELVISTTRLEEGDTLWVRRDELAKLGVHAYHFQTREYDEQWVQIEIVGHADDGNLGGVGLMHGVTLEQEHNAHANEEEQDFGDCYQVVVHCESKDEAREVGELVSDHFSEPDCDTEATGGRADA